MKTNCCVTLIWYCKNIQKLAEQYHVIKFYQSCTLYSVVVYDMKTRLEQHYTIYFEVQI